VDVRDFFSPPSTTLTVTNVSHIVAELFLEKYADFVNGIIGIG